MPLDASIYQAFGVRPKSIADFDAEANAREQNQLALLLGRQKADEYAQGVKEKNALRAVLGGGTNIETPEGQRALYAAAPTLAPGILKERAAVAAEAAKADHLKAQTAGLTLDQSIKLHDRHLAALVGVGTPQDAMAWAEEGRRSGAFTPEQYQRGVQIIQQAAANPQAFAQWKAQAALGGLTVQQQMQQRLERERLAETARSHDLTAQTAVRGQDLADARGREQIGVARGQLGVARERLALEQAAPKGQYDAARGVLVDPRTGEAKPVMLDGQALAPKSTDKPLTDAQAKALLFGSRMQEADRLLGDLAAQGVDQPGLIKRGAEAVPLIGGGLGAVVNTLPGVLGGPSEKQQQVEQAQRDFLNATLRRESGAVISEGEFKNAQRQYFPQPGDSAAVRAQKAANRDLAMRGVLAEVPEAHRGSLDTSGATAPAGPARPATGKAAAPGGVPADIAAILKKYGAK